MNAVAKPARKGRRPHANSVLRGIELAVWALKLERQPTVTQIMETFDVCENTAFRYRAAWLQSNAFDIFHRDLATGSAFRVPTGDMFDGVFDDDERGHRVKYRDGRVVATLDRNACLSAPLAEQLGMSGAFGTFPPPPPWLPIPGAATPSEQSP